MGLRKTANLCLNRTYIKGSKLIPQRSPVGEDLSRSLWVSDQSSGADNIAFPNAKTGLATRASVARRVGHKICTFCTSVAIALLSVSPLVGT